jgi:hypothetical protein
MKINHSFQINSLLKMIALTEMLCRVAGTTTLDREWYVNMLRGEITHSVIR